MQFSERLQKWYQIHHRDLPWRHTQDPYVIWLSEIILQQTRVEQGLPYFYAFVQRFPHVQALASAEEGEVLRLWEGLGYYSRGRNLLKAAKWVMDKWNGRFPTAYQDLLTLPGVGPYTAAAIASFAAGEAKAVVDGNVYRILSRFFGIDLPINKPLGQKYFAELAESCLDKKNPGLHNQAIMEFGALHCKPKQPLCPQCPLSDACVALAKGKIDQLPVKVKGKPVRPRYFHYFILEKESSIAVSQRNLGDIWANLYEFPMLETTEEVQALDLLMHPRLVEWFGENFSLELLMQPPPHLLSHQKIHAKFYKVVGFNDFLRKKSSWNYVLLKDLDTLAKPKVIYTFLKAYLH
jgi:A/G-specific adenine glycosylase